MPSPSDYLLLSPDCYLKSLEELYVYNIKTDDLYENNEEAFDFLKLCDGTRRVSELHFDDDFLKWCLDEKILVLSSHSEEREFVLEKAPRPSLRYLELQITDRCNLRCKHCYLGKAGLTDLPLEQIDSILHEFEQMQGLRLLISGGEPLMHPYFWTINDMLPGFGFRSILLSNGTLIDSEVAQRLKVHEAQISLDGMKESHDYLRGKGSFNKAVKAINELSKSGKSVSVATMVHAKNLDDFPELESLIRELEIREWNVDVPCSAGNLAEHKEAQVPDSVAAPFLEYGFGGGLYSSAPGYACGAHLCTVTPGGKVAKCGFFVDDPVGDVAEGLRNCWERIKHIKLAELRCDCQDKEDCRGGCRFRALLRSGLYAPDPVQCFLRGVR